MGIGPNRSYASYLCSEVLLRVAVVIVFIYTETMHPFERLIHPQEWWLYKNTHAEVPTVSTFKLYIIATCSPLVTLLLLSGIFWKLENDFLPGILSSSLALVFNGLATNAIKLSVGRPRPDFFFRCFPDGHPPHNQPSTYDLQCTGNAADIIEGRKSFPSGHSSFAFVSLGFCAIYVAGKLQCFAPLGRGRSWRLVLSLTPLLLATLICISRTCDYMHHWQDVVVGSLLGLSIAYLCYRQYYPPLNDAACGQPYAAQLTKVKSMHELYEVATQSGPGSNSVKHM